MMKIDKRGFIDHALLLLTIAVSGIPYFSSSTLLIPLFVVLFSVFLLRKKKLDWKFVYLLTFLVVITIVQTYVFNFYSIQSISGVFLRVIIGYLIVKILEEKFIPYFINILYAIAIVSLPIYLSLLLVPGMLNMLLFIAPVFDILNLADSSIPSIVIYTLHIGHLEDLRNIGPFWEPGAFAGYLIIAYIFNFYSVESHKKWKGIILFVAIITTLSTTSYLALFIFYFFAYYNKMKNITLKIIAVLLISISAYYAYFSFDFIGAKIESQIKSAKVIDPYSKENNYTQRFLNILRDVEDFKGHEIVGRGSNPETRYSFGALDQIRTVGITDILVRMGLPFFLLMMYFLYRSVCSYLIVLNKKNVFNCVSIFVTILTTLMSEVYFNFPMYWSLLFLQFVYKKPKRSEMKSRII